MTDKKVSIVIPCYNCTEHISDAVNSALDQDHENIEIICVNDGSTDETPQLLESIKAKAAGKIQVFHNENRGASTARNFGLSKSTGAFIQFLDADDLMVKNKLSVQLNAFENTTDFIVSDRKEVSDDLTETISEITFKKFAENFLESAITEMTGMTGAPLYRKKCIEEINGYNPDLETAQDWDFHIRLILNGARGLYVPGFYYLNRKLKISLSSDYIKVGEDMTRVITNLKDKIAGSAMFNENIRNYILDLFYNAAAHSTETEFYRDTLKEYKWWNPNRIKHLNSGIKNALSRVFGVETVLWLDHKRQKAK